VYGWEHACAHVADGLVSIARCNFKINIIELIELSSILLSGVFKRTSAGSWRYFQQELGVGGDEG